MPALGRLMLPSPPERIVLAELSSARVTFLCEDSHSGALNSFVSSSSSSRSSRRETQGKAEFNYANLLLIIASGDL